MSVDFEAVEHHEAQDFDSEYWKMIEFMVGPSEPYVVMFTQQELITSLAALSIMKELTKGERNQIVGFIIQKLNTAEPQ